LDVRRELEGKSSEDRKKFFASVPEDFRRKALASPYLLGRDKQVEALTSTADTVLVLCGRGWGKNWLGAHWLLDRIETGHKATAAIAETAADVRDDVVDPAEQGSGVLDFAHQRSLQPNHKISQSRVELQPAHGESRIQLYSGDSPKSLRGFSGSVAWIDELAKMRYADGVWDQVNLTLREGGDFGSSQLLITTTPRPTPLIKELVEDEDVHVIRGSSWENKSNLDARFQRQLERLDGTDKGRQEVHAEVLEQAGDLWDFSDINRIHAEDVPELVRIVVGLDPSVSDREGDECGIVLVGMDSAENGYVLEDFSGQYTTTEWAETVVEAFWAENHDWPPADTIHAERNQGGGLVKSQIRSVSERIAYTSTHTTASKRVRAEPIHTLYQNGEVFHVGQHADLEDQMTDFLQTEDSPDRVDALVYAVSELLLQDEPSPLDASHVIGLD
jgi:phage terminase large subunit-like protein